MRLLSSLALAIIVFGAARHAAAAEGEPTLQPSAERFREIARTEVFGGARSDDEKNRLVLGAGLRLFGIKKGVLGLTVVEAYGWNGTNDSLLSDGGFYHVGVRPFVELALRSDAALVAQLGVGLGFSGGLAERVGRDFDGHGFGLSPSAHVLYKTRSPLFAGLGLIAMTPALVPVAGETGGLHAMVSIPVGLAF